MSRASVVGIAVAVAAAAILCAWATVATAAPAAPVARPSGIAIVVRDRVELRAAPRDAANQLATLWQGEALEVRGERLDHLQVWDYHRERGGYVRANQVHRLSTAEPDAPALLAVLRFVRDTPGAESLGIGIAAAWLQAAPAEQLRGAVGVEVVDALGGVADRLAQRASAGAGGNKSAEQRIAAHLDVAARYGVKLRSFERDQKVQVCYDGEAFHRVLASASADAAQRARAALVLTRAECIDPALGVTARAEVDTWRAATLDRVDGTAFAALPQSLRNRLAMQRASVWSAIAFRRARQGEPSARDAAQRSLDELDRVVAGDLTDDDLPVFHDAAMRVNATRWAAQPAAAPALRGVAIRLVAGEPGQTCVELVESRGTPSADATPTGAPLVRRCTFAQVWVASATSSREGNAVALAVQPGEAWRELWLFRRVGRAWTLDVLPPASVLPTAATLGYAEFAGWVPGGSQVLVARESRGDGRYRRSFEVMRLATLAPDRQAGDPASLGAFQRWQDAAWKRDSVAVR